MSCGEGERFRAEVLRQLRSTYGPAVIEPKCGAAGLYAMPGQVGLFARRCRNPVLVAAARGVGPKLKLAQGLGQHESAGTDLVAACVNEVLEEGALPLFFLHRMAGAGIDNAVRLQVIKGIAAGCRQADCALLGGGTAALGCDSAGTGEGAHCRQWAPCATSETPGLPAPGEYDLAGFAVGMVERARLLEGPDKVRPDDAILGIVSSGLHLGGFELARRVLVEKCGMSPEDAAPELGCTLGEELLRPARIYVRAVRAILERYRVKGVVHGLAHVGDGGLGGALTRVMRRRCVARVERAALPAQPIFRLIQRLGGLSDGEMLGSFNLGIGMVVVVAPFYADAAVRRVRRAGDRAVVIGEVVRGDGPAAVVA